MAHDPHRAVTYEGIDQWPQLVVTRNRDNTVNIYSSYPPGPFTYHLSEADARRLAEQIAPPEEARRG